MENWFCAICLLVGFYWLSSAITNAAEEIAYRLEQFTDALLDE